MSVPDAKIDNPNLERSPSQAAVILDRLLAECVTSDASDLHLAPRLQPFLRIHGQLEPVKNSGPTSPVLLEELAVELACRCGREPLGQIGSLDGAITAHNARFRFNVFRRQREISIALRRLEDRFRTLGELGLKSDLYALCELPDGLVVVAGPTGAGKSTTLAALLDRINQTRRCHMVTIEDPIEYIHVPALSLVNQRQVGTDSETFYEALVAALRQDPDVILVGEIRDLNTIRTAIAAAETGHLVFTTVHAADCVGTIERLVSVFPADEQSGIRRQLSFVLRCVIAQHLLVCDGPAGGNSQMGDSSSRRRSRAVTSEVLMVNTAVANLIATAKSSQIYSTMETGTQQGMQTLEEDLSRLWYSGYITEQTAASLSRNPAVLRERYAARRALVSGNGRGGER